MKWFLLIVPWSFVTTVLRHWVKRYRGERWSFYAGSLTIALAVYALSGEL